MSKKGKKPVQEAGTEKTEKEVVDIEKIKEAKDILRNALKDTEDQVTALNEKIDYYKKNAKKHAIVHFKIYVEQKKKLFEEAKETYRLVRTNRKEEIRDFMRNNPDVVLLENERYKLYPKVVTLHRELLTIDAQIEQAEAEAQVKQTPETSPNEADKKEE